MTTVGVLFLDPRVERFLISDEGEVIVDEVRKHWAVMIVPWIEIIGALGILIIGARVPPEAYWVPGILAALLAFHGFWRILQSRMDRFVITNMRVFRVHGILTRRIATMPIARILDISVYTPIIGRILGYGHFVFESAAQEQGLREIRYVGNPNERGLTIQRVIQRSGLRGPIPQREVRQDPVVEVLEGPLVEAPKDPVVEILHEAASESVRPPRWPWGDPPPPSEPPRQTTPVPPADPGEKGI